MKDQYLVGFIDELLRSIQMLKGYMAKGKDSEAACSLVSAFLSAGQIKHRSLNQVCTCIIILCMEMLGTAVPNSNSSISKHTYAHKNAIK